MNKKLNIGLLGGSFNPAHEGHLHISLEAIRYLGLDEVWWLVSPQNPLKSSDDMAPFDKRFASAKEIARNHVQIKITDFETRSGTVYTYDTINSLKKNYNHNFVWLMGADNLVKFHKWHKWEEIFSLVPIAVLDRADYEAEALASSAATNYKTSKVSAKDFSNLATSHAPAWCYINIKKHPASSTEIRSHCEE
ncbi:MAG: nicotinic acid mononucleotide adenylyltransferase [Rickettsiaceae bacterium]|jgi:nicotinate-nucleotide adenylyltransferase|nr:nicotinic acid mononucleotide adenylyltransferase [Rickettsiaceae bacterium]